MTIKILVDKLPEIPGKRYFTIGEVSKLCALKPHVLRYWEREFHQLKPIKWPGSNRRSYQREDIILIRKIMSLLYQEGYTIDGARIQLKAYLKSIQKENKNNPNMQNTKGNNLMLTQLEEVLQILEE